MMCCFSDEDAELMAIALRDAAELYWKHAQEYRLHVTLAAPAAEKARACERMAAQLEDFLESRR